MRGWEWWCTALKYDGASSVIVGGRSGWGSGLVFSHKVVEVSRAGRDGGGAKRVLESFSFEKKGKQRGSVYKYINFL